MIVLASLFVSLTCKASRLCRKHFAKKKSVPMHLKEKTLSYSIKKLLQQHQKRKQRHFFEIRHLSRRNGTKKWCTNLVTLWSWNRSHLFGVQATASTTASVVVAYALVPFMWSYTSFFSCAFFPFPPTGPPQLWIIWDLAFSSSELSWAFLHNLKHFLERKPQCAKILQKVSFLTYFHFQLLF